MSKSLEDIMRQMAAQREAEYQRRIAEERAIYEQRERQRQDYLERIRLYEALTNNVASSSSAAGGGMSRIQTDTTTPSPKALSPTKVTLFC